MLPEPVQCASLVWPGQRPGESVMGSSGLRPTWNCRVNPCRYVPSDGACTQPVALVVIETKSGSPRRSYASCNNCQGAASGVGRERTLLSVDHAVVGRD